ncbi:aminoglycoside phosphotransferase family protein [Paenibacillus lactis]|uniref:aminoglycoside phosphotransferase family protein n=1 Tax=Paenibacillus lactis TaxID=228574 RepID=UPI00368262BF
MKGGNRYDATDPVHYAQSLWHRNKSCLAALAFKVSDDRRAYFLKQYEKSRASTPKWTAAIREYIPILAWLSEQESFRGKVPVPVRTLDGQYRCEDEHGIYLLFEYIEGETIGDKELAGEQVRQLSEIVSELHLLGEEIPYSTLSIRESFEVPFLRQLADRLLNGLPDDMEAEIAPARSHLVKGMRTVRTLSERLAGRNLRMALCHMDLHHWNLMQSGDELVLLDWEGMKLAPVESDLMFMTDTPYFEQFMRIYRTRHNGYQMDEDALRFYQIRRRLEDIWEFMEQLLYDEQAEEERRNTLGSLRKELLELKSEI